MGREAECVCTWGSISKRVKALLESGELILRGGIRRNIPLAGMREVRCQGGRLCFHFEGEAVLLDLGEGIALKWCKAIETPPPTLAKKLGVTSKSMVWVWGEAVDQELLAALEKAKGQTISPDGPGSLNDPDGLGDLGQGDMMVLCVGSMRELEEGLSAAAGALGRGVPVWIVYPKGKGKGVGENHVRSAARSLGLIDSKVASISSTLTGQKFIKKK